MNLTNYQREIITGQVLKESNAKQIWELIAVVAVASAWVFVGLQIGIG